jgi:hypothetical protein
MRVILWIVLATIVLVEPLRKPLVAEPAAAAGQVLVNGTPVPRGNSRVDIEQTVIEFREGGGDEVRLLPGPIAYRLCIVSPHLIPAVEAAYAPGTQNPFLEVVVEDGRAFGRCLVESSRTFPRHPPRGSTSTTDYCLRCEGPG